MAGPVRNSTPNNPIQNRESDDQPPLGARDASLRIAFVAVGVFGIYQLTKIVPTPIFNTVLIGGTVIAVLAAASLAMLPFLSNEPH